MKDDKMALNISDINTEITLELDREEIPINDFRKAVENFLGLIKEVTKASFPKKNPSDWLVKVYPGSAGIGVLRKPGAFTNEEVSIVRSNVNNGIRLLHDGERPPFFSDKAIEHSKGLGSLFSSKKIPSKVRLWGVKNEPPLNITRTLSDKAIYLLEAAYEEDGSIDGILEKLNGHGQYEFVVYDLIDDRPITCEVGQEDLKIAWESFLKRVEVIGKVRYRRDGMPVSVKASKIVPFPTPNEIPDLNTMRLLLSEN